MRLASILAAAGALLALAGPAHAAEQVLYVGDSLGVGTTPGFARALGSDAQVHGDSRIGRPSGEGLTVLGQSFSPSDDIVVFDLGTNDDPAQPGRLAADLAAARRLTGSRCMIVATLNRPPLNGVSVDGLNSAVLAFAGKSPSVQLVDWNAIASSEPSLLGPDHIHPTPQGYSARAQLFAEAVAACGTKPAAEPPPVATTNPPKRTRPRRKPQPRIKVPGIDASGISFTEPAKVRGLNGEVLLPNTKPPYPAVVMLNGGRAQAEFLAAHGIAVVTFPFRRSVADARAAVALLHARDDVREDGVGIWGFAGGADVAAQAAAGNPGVGAVLAVAPGVLAPAAIRDWSIRRALGSPAPAVTTWLQLRARSDAALRTGSAAAWRRVAQPVLAVWGTRDSFIPIRASAAALRDALAGGPNRDRTFRFFDAGHAGAVVYRHGQPVFAPGFLEESSRWLGTRLGVKKAKPRMSTPLPPSRGWPTPVDIADASFATAPATQAVWLALPAILLALAALRRRRAHPAGEGPADLAGEGGAHPAGEGGAHPGRFMAAAAIADLGALAATAAGVADVLASGGRDVSEIGGTPWLFALAIALAAAGFALTLRLARDRIWLAVAGSGGWLALALFWLL